MKHITSILLSAVLLLSLTGCSSSNAENSAKTSSSSLQVVDSENIIEGKVTKVNGNEIIMDLGTINKTERQNPEKPDSGSVGSKPEFSGSRPDKNTTERPARENSSSGSSQADSSERTPPSNDMPNSGANSGFSMGNTTIELSGESKTINIPVGTPVYMTVRGESSEVDFTRISKDNLIRVTMSQDGNVISVTVVK